MNLIKYPTAIINAAATEAGTTAEEYVAKTRSFFLGRVVCAHFEGTEDGGATSVFSLS